MSSKTLLRTYFDEIPAQAQLNIVRHAMSSSRIPNVDDDGSLDVVQISPCLVHFANTTHLLHNASVELLRKLSWKELRLFPSEAMQALFTVYGPRCSSLTLDGIIKYHLDHFVHVLDSCKYLKKLTIQFCGPGGDFLLR